MGTCKSRPCRTPRALCSLAALAGSFALSPSAAWAQDLAQAPHAAAATPGDEQVLYLGVTLNGVASEDLTRFVRLASGALAAPAQALRDLGLRWPGSESADGLVPLEALPGAAIDYDHAGQQLRLTVPVDLLDRLPLRLSADTRLASREVAPADPGVPGVLVNYDLYTQGSGDRASLSAWSEIRLFGAGPGVWSHASLARTRWEAGGPATTSVRLDSSWRLEFAQEMLAVTAGDTATGAVSWSRSVRIGGLRVGREFSLQPYRSTTPLASFLGEAVLPSTVDLYINGLRQSTQRVPPGRFLLDAVPTLAGSGVAQVVVTDINGQARATNFSFYGAASLLQEGLWDWSAEAGFVRRDYGVRSFSYDREPVASATARHGWSDDLTLEAHAEAADGLQLMGAGGVWRVGGLGGLLSASLAASRSAAGSGHQRSLGYQWSSAAFSFSAQSLRRGAGYADIGSRADGGQASGSDAVFASFGSPLGGWGLGYARQLQAGRPPSRVASLNWSNRLPGDSSVSVGIARDLGRDGGTSAYLSWMMSLGPGRSLGAGASRQGGRSSLSAQASQSAPTEGGWGWRVQAGTAEDGLNAQAQVSRTTLFGEWNAGLARNPGSQTAYAGGNGSLLWMAGGLRAMRSVDDAFAVVSTDGVAGVPVRLENRLIGHTEADGLLFVPQLSAYQRNRLAIDTLGLPYDMRAERITAETVPQGRSGAFVRFGLRRVAAVQLGLHDAAGRAVPAGSTVTLDPGGSSAVVGYDGLVYLEDPPQGAVLDVLTPAGRCKATLPAAPGAGLADLGTLVCR